MQLLFEQCMECDFGVTCYERGFDRCAKIEMAGQGLGVPIKQRDDSWKDRIPFGVYMGLKHIIQRVNDPNYVDPDVPKLEYPRLEFAKRLAMETDMTHEAASCMVSEISLFCDIKEAIQYYNMNGLRALELYLDGHKAMARG